MVTSWITLESCNESKLAQLTGANASGGNSTNLERTHGVGSELNTVEPVDTGELRTLDMVDRLSTTDDATSTRTFQ